MTIQQVHWSREVQNSPGDSLKSRHSIFLAPFVSMFCPSYWSAENPTYFDSLQFTGEVRRKVNKLHILAKKVLPGLHLVKEEVFFANLITRPLHNMDQLKNHRTRNLQIFQVGWTAQPVWKETTCMARQSEEDDTLKLEVNRI